MARPLAAYSWRELLRGRPALFAIRDFRDHWRFRRRMIQPGPDDLAALRPRLRSKNLLITIAYNYSDVIGQQIPLVKKHVRDCIHVIADNSSNPVAAGTIRDLAGSHGSQYVRIPSFEWESPNASHSHALNWTWRNVIRPAGPAAFGFIDHDIFPVRATDPFSPLAGYPVAGRVWDGQFDGRWHLWAGFCFFRTDYVSGRRLNFALDFYGGLDTGGRNWKPLYRHLDRDAVPDPGFRREEVRYDGVEFRVQWIGDWLHRSSHGHVQLSTRAAKDRWFSDYLAGLAG